MGTHDTNSGHPLHDPALDAEDAASPFEVEVLSALEDAQRLAAQLRDAEALLQKKLEKVVMALLPAGSVLKGFDVHGFGRIHVKTGNARGARTFQTTSDPWITSVGVLHPLETRFAVRARPLNDQGKILSGRAGNSRFAGGRDDLLLSVDLADHRGPDDDRSEEDVLMAVVTNAVASMRVCGEPEIERAQEPDQAPSPRG